MALHYYAGRRASDAEDGAVGCLIDHVASKIDHQSIDELIKRLAHGLKYWDEAGLKRAFDVWIGVVDPWIQAAKLAAKDTFKH
jgi:hypothetical protein